MIRLAASVLFLAVLAISGAVPASKLISPFRQRQIKKLVVRREELQQQIIQADQDIQKLNRERQVADIELKTTSRSLSSALDNCQSDGLRCGPVADMRVAVAMAREKLSSIKLALSKLKDPERVQQRQGELAEVSGQIGFMTKMLFPKPSVFPRPVGR